MNAKLLDEFFSEDGDAHARHKLLDDIRGYGISHTAIVREYMFNRFNVTLNFEIKEVTIGDDLTVGPEGEFRISMGEFEKALLKRE